MKYFLLVVVCCSNLFVEAQKSDDPRVDLELNVEQMKEDLLIYRSVLEETHPGLYRYTSKTIIQNKFDSTELMINRPMPFYEYYRLLAKLNAEIRCAHSFIMPFKEVERFAQSGAKMLPVYLYIIQEKYYILFNGSNNENIFPGDEVLAINGKSMELIKNEMKEHLWADGYNSSGKKRLLMGGYFPLFYYFFIDQSEAFNMELRDMSGHVKTELITAQFLNDSRNNYSKNSVNKHVLRKFRKIDKKIWSLKFMDKPSGTAMLSLRSFGKPSINSEEEALIAIQEFMDDSLKKMNRKKTNNLILDLRKNGGGWDIIAVELLSYFIRNETTFYASQHAITNDSEYLKYSDLKDWSLQRVNDNLIMQADGKFRLNNDVAPGLNPIKPKNNSFKGKLYILMDESSGSATSEFLAIAKSNNIGVLVGQESGGVYEGGNAGSFIQMELPNTQIYFQTPLILYKTNVIEPSHLGRGTIPDYTIDFTVEDLLNRNDRQLQFVMKLIEK